MSDSEDFKDVKPSYKRSANDDRDGPSSKRNAPSDDEHVAIKILIPSSAVGAIIGKGGEAMRQLKHNSQCKVQMSKTSDTYPGTTERVCLVKGSLSNVIIAIRSIQEKIFDKCDSSTAIDHFDHKGVNRGSELKIVMPNTSAGMVIGKAGANIKEIRDSLGCQIQVFPKAGTAEAKSSAERVVTLAHDQQDKLLAACQRVIEKVSADPHHESEINKEDRGDKRDSNIYNNPGERSFSNAPAPYSSQSATNGTYGYGSPFTNQPPQIQSSPQKFNPYNGLGNTELLTFLDNLQSTLRNSGFNETGVSEVMSAMQVLAKYNIMGLGLGLGVAAMAQLRTSQEQGGGWRSN